MIYIPGTCGAIPAERDVAVPLSDGGNQMLERRGDAPHMKVLHIEATVCPKSNSQKRLGAVERKGGIYMRR